MITILLIEDEDDLRQTLRRILEMLPLAPGEVRVVEAADGVAGFSLFFETEPDLVITDVMMPVKDGIETIRDIRALNPKARIIAMSGGGGVKYPDPLALAKQCGAVETLEKPIRREQLRSAVARVLGLSL